MNFKERLEDSQALRDEPNPHHVAGELLSDSELFKRAVEVAADYQIPQRRLTVEENREHWGKRE